jgi:chemotaxis protein methyltransferase CheR
MIEDEIEIENIELQLLLQAIYLKYGYDFRNYAKASIKRRVLHRMNKEGITNISAMQHKVLYDVSFFERLLLDMSVNVTEMFRDPSFYLAVREQVLPKLAAYDYIKVWHAGCSSGEEAYSMAILLKEANLYDKTQIYATDMNQVVLKQAKEGIFSIRRLQQYTTNYQKSGGKEAFSNYYTAHYDHVVMDSNLKKNILFSDHNLAVDNVFGEMHLILCRNVLIYFNRELQDRVIKLFMDSLCDGGFLCLGTKESLRLSKYSNSFDYVLQKEQIYVKKNP